MEKQAEKIFDRKNFAMDREEWENKRDGYVAAATQKVLREFIGGIGINSKEELLIKLFELVGEEIKKQLGAEYLSEDEYPEKKIMEIIEKYLNIGSLSDDLNQTILELHRN